MSVNSLPSFAQAFSAHSIPVDHSNALPPIVNMRKRSNEDEVRVKDESDDEGAPPPSAVMPSPLKKRRVTVSGGAPQPLRIDVRPPKNQDQSVSTPISPVVMGFTIQRDNPAAIEQIRSMISVKQKQKALIEQRRGSAAGVMSPTTAEPPASRSSTANNSSIKRTSSPKQTPLHLQQQQAIQQQREQQQQLPAPAAPPSISQHSLPPPPISFARRRAALMGGKKKPADIVISPREAHTRDQLQPAIQSAPPIPQAGGQSSFYTSGRFQMALPRLPNISGDNPRRVATNVPPTPTRLSTSLAIQQERSSFVQQIHNTNITPHNNNNQTTAPTTNNRSPPAAPSVPISHSATLVPPTPTSLHRPGYQGDKAAFLAPFETFYDALNDSKQLKEWLGEQLQKSQSLMRSVTQQQERLTETIDAVVEKRLSGMKTEMTGLRRRIEELEEALHRSQQQQRRLSIDHLQQHPKQQHYHHPPHHQQQNGVVIAESSYKFPPVSETNATASSSSSSRRRPELTRRLSSPGWQQQSQNSDRDRESGGGPGTGAVGGKNGGSHSPDSRRVLTTVGVGPRSHDLPPPPQPVASSSNLAAVSPPLSYRERESAVRHALPPTPPVRPAPLSRQNSTHTSSVSMSTLDREREREWERERERENREREREWEREREREKEREREREQEESSASNRRVPSRRNSVVMGDLENAS